MCVCYTDTCVKVSLVYQISNCVLLSEYLLYSFVSFKQRNKFVMKIFVKPNRDLNGYVRWFICSTLQSSEKGRKLNTAVTQTGKMAAQTGKVVGR